MEETTKIVFTKTIPLKNGTTQNITTLEIISNNAIRYSLFLVLKILINISCELNKNVLMINNRERNRFSSANNL